jgi:hypothetical protein
MSGVRQLSAQKSAHHAIETANNHVLAHQMRLTLAFEARPEANPLFPEISSDRRSRPRPDEHDRKRGIRTF